jgi:hypothetical protein
MNVIADHTDATATDQKSFYEKLNGPWHERALWIYMAVVLLHWTEHFTQAFQIYVLGWRVPDARGLCGLWYPSLVKLEILHYSYALIMLVALWVLRKGFVGRSRRWWMAAFWIQFWHHIEHALLQGQVISGYNLFGSPVPTSLAQLLIPRVELHLFYNTIVTVPMLIAMVHHLFPSSEERAHMRCGCAHRAKSFASRPEVMEHAPST